jgi:large subunit ribosomal protein L15
MKLHELGPLPGSKHRRKRVGRGEGSGLGKTSGRGHKGQKARSGGGTPPGFEGGQMPLQRRLPKRGFTNIFKKVFSLVNIGSLAAFEAGSVIDAEALAAVGLVRQPGIPVKLLAKGDIESSVTIKVQAASQQAIKKVEAAGGKVELLTL